MKRLLWSFLGIVVLVSTVCFVLPAVVLNKKPVETILVDRLEKITGRKLEFQSFRVSYFPFVQVHLDSAFLVPKRSSSFQMKAADVKVYLARLPLLIGKVEISKMVLTGGDLQFEFPAFPQYEIIHVENAHLELGGLTARAQIPFEISGAVDNIGQAITAKGAFSLNSLEQWNWDASKFGVDISIHDVNLDGFKTILKDFLGITVVGGTWSGSLQVEKRSSQTKFKMISSMRMKNFSYRLEESSTDAVSPQMDVNAEYDIDWDPEKEILEIDRLRLKFPPGQIEVQGTIDSHNREVKNVRVSAKDFVLETIPQYFIGLKQAIPFNIGFSGLSNAEMVISGNWDDLILNGNMDLTRALLTYARYFSKPKDHPLNFTFDYGLKNSRILSGDFSVRINDVTMKGSLTDLDVTSGQGQINIITNKFHLKGWEKLIPPIQNFQMDGEAKLLANFKGDLQKIYDTKTTINLTVENGKITSEKGSSLQDINLSLDLSPLAFDMRKAEFSVNNSRINTSLLVYGLKDNPSVEFSAASSEVSPSEVFSVLGNFASEWLTPQESKIKNQFLQQINAWFPTGETVSDLDIKAAFKDKVWTLNKLTFGAYQGQASFQGSWKISEWPGFYQVTASAEKINLNRFFLRGKKELSGALLEGILFVNGTAEGSAGETWLDTLHGKGTYLVTNGVFHTFDLFQTLSKISDFENLGGHHEGETPFNDLRSSVQIEKQKILMQDLIMLMDNARIQATGDVNFKGALNYRLDVYIAPSFLPKPLDLPSEQSKDFVGPVPLLLSGPIENPELKPDLPQIPNLLGRILKRKPEKALNTFLSEDFFTDPNKKS